jgi:hypothetical protein
MYPQPRARVPHGAKSYPGVDAHRPTPARPCFAPELGCNQTRAFCCRALQQDATSEQGGIP